MRLEQVSPPLKAKEHPACHVKSQTREVRRSLLHSRFIHVQGNCHGATPSWMSAECALVPEVENPALDCVNALIPKAL